MKNNHKKWRRIRRDADIKGKKQNNFKSDKMVPATDGRLNTHKHFQPF